MKFAELFKQLQINNYYVFSLTDILSFYPHEGRANLKRMISRWLRKGWITSLKRGLYELTYPKDFIIHDMFIANRLYCPSYVSMETVLSHCSIIPEVSMAVTSLTTKPTRKFRNKHGLFIYRTIKPVCFTGYFVEKQGIFSILIAEPEKAIVDYVYFKTYRNKRFDFIEERLDKDKIMRLNKKKIYKYARLYDMDIKRFYAQL